MTGNYSVGKLIIERALVGPMCRHGNAGFAAVGCLSAGTPSKSIRMKQMRRSEFFARIREKRELWN